MGAGIPLCEYFKQHHIRVEVPYYQQVCLPAWQCCVFLETDFYHVPGRDMKYYNQRVCVSAYVHWYV